MMITPQSNVDREFTIALPKAELHAHLSGSVDINCLRRIWLNKRALDQCHVLEDPAIALRPNGDYHDIASFFPLFDRYIYHLCNDLETIKYMCTSVLENFENDGVVHLELRTTPRDNAASGLTKEEYVRGVSEAIKEFNGKSNDQNRMQTTLILSIDRRMTTEEAEGVVDLAIRHKIQARGTRYSQDDDLNFVVGVDLCGNPAKGDVRDFTEVFGRAKANGLGITIHFAEIPQSSTERELKTILSWHPDRLGHVIHVKPQFADIIEKRRVGLELCLSCNVLAKLTPGGFSDHHFGKWMRTGCPIALGTDDVGVFGSPLSNEYLLAATHFKLGRKDLVNLSRSAAGVVFNGRERLLSIIEDFEKQENKGH